MEMDPDTARKLEVGRGRVNEYASEELQWLGSAHRIIDSMSICLDYYIPVTRGLA